MVSVSNQKNADKFKLKHTLNRIVEVQARAFKILPYNRHHRKYIFLLPQGRDIDAIARAPLWALGLNYRHGTGHGIGMFLHVHEGPGRINIGYRATKYEEPLYANMIFSIGRRRYE